MELFNHLGARISEWLPDVPDLADLAKGSSVSLAVTGLSRAGKTVFITSLVHNLLSALHQPYRMPLLTVIRDRRLLPPIGLLQPPISARSRLTSGSCLPAPPDSCSAGLETALQR